MMPKNLTPNQRAAYREMLEEALLKQGKIEFVTTGTSMRYMMGDGDRVLVRGCNMSDLRCGDVVLLKDRAQANRIYIVHRIINIKKQADKTLIETKGDSSPKDCFLFDSETCLGKVVTFTHDGQAYSLEHRIWAVIDPLIALMSKWVSHYSKKAAIRGKKKQVFVQRLLHSVIKRLVKLGMFASRQAKTPFPMKNEKI